MLFLLLGTCLLGLIAPLFPSTHMALGFGTWHAHFSSAEFCLLACFALALSLLIAPA